MSVCRAVGCDVPGNSCQGAGLQLRSPRLAGCSRLPSRSCLLAAREAGRLRWNVVPGVGGGALGARGAGFAAPPSVAHLRCRRLKRLV